MKLDICTKHLRILDLINFTRGENLEFIESSLSISRPNLNNYLKEIHKLIPHSKKTGKMDIIIKDILKTKNLYTLLLKYQNVSKEDRIFFLTLKILVSNSLNLDSLANYLNLSRRTLNRDLVNIKENLNIFDLEIISLSGKGIFLEGDFLNVKRALCCYIYKYFVEKQYLPSIFEDDFGYLLEDESINSQLNPDIEKLVLNFNLDTFFYNRILLKAFYYSFHHLDSSSKEETSTIKHCLKKKFDFETYFSKVFHKSELNSFYDFLHSSVFKDLYFEEIGNFLNILKICSGNFPEQSIFLDEYVSAWQDIFKKSIGQNFPKSKFRKLEKFIVRIAFAKNQKHYLPIFELEFLNLNIDIGTARKCISLYNEFKLHYWNISFTDVLMLYFLVMFDDISDKKEIFVVYKEIPKYLLLSLKEGLEAKYNLIILDFINILHFEEFIKNNDVSTVGVFKDFNFSNDSLQVIHLDLKI